MSELNQSYTARSATTDDIEALFNGFNRYWETLTGFIKFTLDDIQTIFSTPGFDLPSSTLAIHGPGNQVVAAAIVIDLNNPPVHPNFYGYVEADHCGQGIGGYLLGWGEDRARQAIEHCPEGARVSMYAQTSQSHQPTIAVLQKAGLNPVRYSWYMSRDLAQSVPEPQWPFGFHLTTYKEDSDLETILKAVDEVFQDHWGHIDHTGDQERFERFKHAIESDEEFDPSIWFLAMDGDQIAGVALCDPRVGPDRETGHVNILGVRRPWRKRGLGLALLHHAFGEFKRRGYQRVTLGVDTENLSGATRLYKKAGMRVAGELAVYEKELRAGEELTKQA
jgi:GNAT superfamily N-acetyltransferase